MEQLAMCFDEPERWLPVVGWEDLYEVSDLGRVRSLPRVVERRGKYEAHVRISGRILKPSYDGPRATVGLCRDGKSQTFSVHRLVTRAFLGPCPEGMEVCHGPAGRLDNSLTNLSYGTHLKNCGEDMRRDGTIPAGIRNASAILTDEIVLECRARAAAGESRRALAIEFGVAEDTIADAVAGVKWRHLAQPPIPLPAPELSSPRRGRPSIRPIPGYEYQPYVPARRASPGGKQVVSVRWDEPLLQAAKLHADSRGLTVSDVVRLAVTSYLEANPDSPPAAA